MSVSFNDLDADLQKRIGALEKKPGMGFTIAMACVASLFFPLTLMVTKEYFIDRPKENVELVYDITQPRQHLKNEYITHIEIENIGRKEASSTIILEVAFRGKVVNHEWVKEPDPTNVTTAKIALPTGETFRIELKALGPGAKVALRFKSEEDLLRLPILKHNEVIYPPRSRDTIAVYQ